MKKTQCTPELISRLKRETAALLIPRFSRMIGLPSLFLSFFLALILYGIFGVNFKVAFPVLFMVWAFLIAMLMPFKIAWKSCYVDFCREEGLWDESDRIAFEDAGSAVQNVLEGKPPQGDFKCESSTLMKIHRILLGKGDFRKSVRLREWVLTTMREACKNGGDLLRLEPSEFPDAISSEEGILGVGYFSIGRYAEGIELMRKRLDSVKSNPSRHPGSFFFAHIALVDAFAELHNINEAEKILSELRMNLDTFSSLENFCKTGEEPTEQVWWGELDGAVYGSLLGRLMELKGEPEADKVLIRAGEIMQKQENRDQLMQLYPEIQILLGLMALKVNNFSGSEKLAKEALDYYDKETRFYGPKYWMARGLLAYSRLRLGSSDNLSVEFEAIVNALQEGLEKEHLDIASCLVWQGESLIMAGKAGPAREALEEALKIRSSHFPANDPEISEIQNLLRKLSSPS